MNDETFKIFYTRSTMQNQFHANLRGYGRAMAPTSSLGVIAYCCIKFLCYEPLLDSRYTVAQRL